MTIPISLSRGAPAAIGAAALSTAIALAPSVVTPPPSFAGGGASTIRVSVSTQGGQADDDSKQAAISGSGRSVVFASDATHLVARDTNGSTDVFIRDLRSGTTRRLSVGPNGRQANGDSTQPVISRNGQVVLYVSKATNLVSGDTNASIDVFVWTNGKTRKLSATRAGRQSNGDSFQPAISGDGTVAAFESKASNLAPGDTNHRIDVYRRSVAGPAASIRRVSIGATGQQGNDASFGPSVDGNGDVIAFMSTASNLVADDTNHARDVFVRASNTTTVASLSSSGDLGDGDSVDPAISGNGDVVAFSSDATNLVAGDGNANTDVFVHVVSSGRTEAVSVRGASMFRNGRSDRPAISLDGRRVAFASSARLAVGDTNRTRDVYVRNRAAATTVRITRGRQGQANGNSDEPTISSSGAVAFESVASNLVRLDTNHVGDIFVSRM